MQFICGFNIYRTILLWCAVCDSKKGQRFDFVFFVEGCMLYHVVGTFPLLI
jgi:hypothetical protein